MRDHEHRRAKRFGDGALAAACENGSGPRAEQRRLDSRWMGRVCRRERSHGRGRRGGEATGSQVQAEGRPDDCHTKNYTLFILFSCDEINVIILSYKFSQT